MSLNESRPRLRGDKRIAYDNLNTKERRILVIGDIHAPFELDGYLEFCQETYSKYLCNQVIYIGDIIDNHYTSYHETSSDAMGGLDELEYAIRAVKRWSDAFPVADVLIGNHDRMVMRKAQTSDIPSAWIKSYNEVLGTNWNWTERIVYDGVQFVHGEGGTASTKSKNDMMSTVQGHIHTQCYTMWSVGRNLKVFGMQVGCGVNGSSYAAAYAKNFKKQAIGCGVVLGGHTAINCLMDL